MKTLLSLFLLLALGASAATGIKISEYPNTPVLTNSELFIVAVTNVTPATNRNISYGQLRSLLSSNNFVGSFNGDARNASNVVYSAVATNLSISVKSFGAKGDLATDDTSSIQSALNSISSSAFGGTVLFPSGTYRITSSLVVTQQNIQFLGDNSDSVILLGTNSGMTLVVVSNSTFSARKLTLQGDASYYGTNGTTLGINLAGTPGNGGNDVDATICDCVLLRHARAIDIHGRNVKIDQCLFSTCTTNAVNISTLYGGGGSPDYRALHISGCRFHGIGIVDPAPVQVINCPTENSFTDLFVVNNYADSCGLFFFGYANGLALDGNNITHAWGGIEIDATGYAGPATRLGNLIANNIIWFFERNAGANNRNGIALTNVSQFIIQGNHVGNCTYHGIELVGSFNNSIIGNYLADVGMGTNYDGIRIESGSQQNLIAGNAIYEVTQYGGMRYGVANLATQNHFANNLVYGYVTNGNEFYSSTTAYGQVNAALTSSFTLASPFISSSSVYAAAGFSMDSGQSFDLAHSVPGYNAIMRNGGIAMVANGHQAIWTDGGVMDIGGNISSSGAVIATNAFVMPPVSAGPVWCTNGLACMWNSNNNGQATIYLRTSAVGATTFADKLVAP